jgi:hypothetical protein
MFAHPIHQSRQYVLAATMVLALVSVCIATWAFAGSATDADPRAIGMNIVRIDADAGVSDNGRHLIVTGPLACTKGEVAYVSLRVTQHRTGATAEGRTRLMCTGTTQQWQVHAGTTDDETFEAGAATAVAYMRSTMRQYTTDARQWLVVIRLLPD